VLILYDFRLVRGFDKIGIIVSGEKMKSLSIKCLPLLIYGICTNSIVSGARYFIELIHGEQALGYYATVSTVAVLVQAMVTMIFTPLIGVFNEAYNDGDKKRVTGLLLKLVALLTGVTLVAMIAIYFLGDFAMTLVFGEGIRPYVYLLYPTVIASCITAFMWLMGMLLVVMRDTRTLMGGAIVGIVLSVTLCLLLIPDSCYTGANIAIITALSLISIIYLIRFLVYLFNKGVEHDGN
jgi:O-antigen/teichoic acid export membrane protein